MMTTTWNDSGLVLVQNWWPQSKQPFHLDGFCFYSTLLFVTKYHLLCICVSLLLLLWPNANIYAPLRVVVGGGDIVLVVCFHKDSGEYIVWPTLFECVLVY